MHTFHSTSEPSHRGPQLGAGSERAAADPISLAEFLEVVPQRARDPRLGHARKPVVQHQLAREVAAGAHEVAPAAGLVGRGRLQTAAASGPGADRALSTLRDPPNRSQRALHTRHAPC
eukprot:3302197-Rhodomonas_salina.2